MLDSQINLSKLYPIQSLIYRLRINVCCTMFEEYPFQAFFRQYLDKFQTMVLYNAITSICKIFPHMVNFLNRLLTSGIFYAE